MDTNRLLLIVLVMALVTFFTRAIPFIFFSRKDPPQLFSYLQIYIPPVVMLILVFSSFKDYTFTVFPDGGPAVIAGLATALVHFWKHNVLLSIIGGTVLYMMLIRFYTL
ncbi:branched-chain amino acid transporter permease [Gracilinema caldarium]|uniref:Branched-chain amino acid transport n=1 Tax=Gracilinema caldarium (strain ATCC 51460 / DSM 7334 / H1) TaxID=744872 RepID=F8EX66_GRAC1|nr:AzlD domain-containing protein [Gracilinema caldarium]AEJ18809.1 branched-chain amino acid transport [Gracilinema caldarium DSM 7334]